MKLLRSRAALLCVFLVALIASPISTSPASASSTITVESGNLAGFSAATTAGATGEFVSGPGTAPNGTGSYRQTVTASGDKAEFNTSRFNGSPLASLTQLSYATYVATNTGVQAPAIKLRLDTDGDGTTDDGFSFEPAYQTGNYPMVSGASPTPNQCVGNPGCVSAVTWQSWNARAGGWWSNSSATVGPPLDTIDNFVAAHPGTKLATDSASLSIASGSGWTNFDGNFDALSVNGLTFDFELAPAAAAGTVVVTDNAPNNWSSDPSRCGGGGASTGSTDYARGPGVTPAGLGGVAFTTGTDGNSIERIRNSGYAGTRLDQLDELSYSTFVSAGGPTVGPTLILDVDTNDDAAGADQLFFEPYYQSTGPTSIPKQGALAQGAWQTWDALAGGWWSPNTPTVGPPGAYMKTLAYYVTLYPNAIITNPGGKGGISLQAGCGAPVWDNFAGNVDNLTIGVASSSTTFDFEPVSEIVDCDASTDDIAAVQSIVNIVPDDYTIKLKGTCDFSLAAPHGGSVFSNDSAAVLIRPNPPVHGLTITSAGASQSATVVGSGTQTAFEIAPGNDDVTIRGLKFTNLARPIVAVNTKGTTIGGGSGLPPTYPSGTNTVGNVITGGAAMNSAVLALATSITSTLKYGVAGALSESIAAGALEDLTVYGNAISYTTPGTPDGNTKDVVGVDVRHRGDAQATNINISDNTVNFTGSSFPSFNINSVRVFSHAPVATPFIQQVKINNNEFGLGPEEVNSAGRAGIVVRGVDGLKIQGNGLRANLSSTSVPMPGGGIVVSDSQNGTISNNFVRLLGDPQTLGTDLGAISVIDDLLTLFGGTNTGPATSDMLLSGNIIAPTTHRAFVLNGVSHATITGTDNKNATGKISIGEKLSGPGNATDPTPKTLQKAVTRAVVCDNTLKTSTGATTPYTASSLSVDAGSTATNAYPGGTLDCAVQINAIPSYLQASSTLTVGGKAWSTRPITVTVSDGTNTISAPAGNTDASGSFTHTFSVSDLSPALDDGALTATATVTDDLALGLSKTASLTTTKDAVAPAPFTIDPITPNPIGSAAASNVNVTGTTEPGTTVKLKATDSAASSTSLVNATVTGGTWSATINVSSLTGGLLTFDATSSDSAGNQATASEIGTLDKTAPSIAITTITAPISTATASAITVSGTVADSVGDIALKISKGAAFINATAPVTAGSFTKTVNVSSLPDGTLTFVATATDSAGNSSADTKTRVKDTLTNVTLSAIDTLVNNTEQTTFAAAGTAEIGDTIIVSATDTVNTVSSGPLTATTGTYSATLNLTLLSDGPITVTSAAADAFGNTASASRSSVLDTIAPMLTADSITDPIDDTNETAVSVSGLTDEDAVSLSITDGTSSTPVIQADIGAGTWSATPISVSGFLNGGITATATTQDQAGNISTATISATKNAAVSNPPTVEPEANPSGIITNEDINEDGEFIVNVTHNGPTASDTYTVTVSGPAPVPANSAASGSSVVTAPPQSIQDGQTNGFGFDAGQFDDGELTIFVSNNGGTNSSVSVLDTTPPEVTIDTPADFYFARGYLGLNDLVFTGTASDEASQITNVIVELKSGTEVVRANAQFSRGPKNIDWEADFTDMFNRLLTDHLPKTGTITAWSIDRAGLKSEKLTSRSFTIL